MYVDSREKVTARYQVCPNRISSFKTFFFLSFFPLFPFSLLMIHVKPNARLMRYMTPGIFCLPSLVDLSVKERSHGVWKL